jgi:putative tricarboxylic transport membrane protein
MVKFHDRHLGVMMVALGAAITGLAMALPGPITGAHIAYGPGFFPSLLGVATMLAGLALAIRGPQAAKDGDASDAEAKGRPRFVAPLLVLASMRAYVYLSDTVGFLPMSMVILVLLLMVGGMRFISALLLSLATSIAIYLLFSKVLMVPLPRGLLQSWAIWL